VHLHAPIFGAVLSLLIAMTPISVSATEMIDLVRVLKAERKIQLIAKGQIIREFPISLGGKPVGHKRQSGDQHTPEGKYILDYKKSDSAFYKAIHISYPNFADIENARKAGVSPGGQIMIHGQKNGLGWLAPLTQRFDWTNGCVALSNKDMDEVWNLVKVGAAIELVP
jgi:murein L,D-transpeptidase YafK